MTKDLQTGEPATKITILFSQIFLFERGMGQAYRVPDTIPAAD